MKKTLCILVISSILFSICGCVGHRDDPVTTDITESVPTQDHIKQLPIVSVAVPVTTKETKSQDGTVIFRYKHQSMSLILPDPDVADRIIIDFLEKIDVTKSTANETKKAALSDYSTGENWTPYLCQILYNPSRVDNSVISLFGSLVTYSGSAHPEAAYLSVSYDLSSGKSLRLFDVLTADASAETLASLAVEALKGHKNLYEDYKETVEHRILTNFKYDTGWYLSPDGLCFYFAPYEIAPYAAGVITATIPYSMLAGILNDAYFPPELETATGDLKVIGFDSKIHNKFSQISELALQDSGSKCLFYTDSLIYDFCIEISSDFSSDKGQTIFVASSLSPGDAVLLEGIDTKNINTLKVRYSSNGKTHYRYIVCDFNKDTFSLKES